MFTLIFMLKTFVYKNRSLLLPCKANDGASFIMTFRKAEQYLFDTTPLFQQRGKSAYKPGLGNSVKLDQHFGRPHLSYKTIHIGGTNGKGSVAHTLAAILQAQGYRVGLFTSPHLVTFRERIRVNGEMISEERVIRFVEEERQFFEPLHPTFFELTTALAFKYFEECFVDVAVVEVGLGGRLDCTNIISPILTIITNIGFDHTDLLGDTLPKIAREKAGIFKQGVPAVVGESNADTADVFQATARLVNAPLFYAQHEGVLNYAEVRPRENRYETADYGNFSGQLTGQLQVRNARTILTALRHLSLPVSAEAVQRGFAEVCQMTGLQGRWQVVSNSPETVCDTAHNIHSWQVLAPRLAEEVSRHTTHIIFGMAADKDVEAVLDVLPAEAHYYFTQASVRRAMPATDLAEKASAKGLQGKAYPDVSSAYNAAMEAAEANDFIFIGGSSFVVADFLTLH